MKRFWLALLIAMYFYARTDILIWQRIFESHQLWDLGIGAYHWGWVNSLFGFMLLGILVSYPSLRRMIVFPIYLGILAFSGFEDVLYYWLDGRGLPSVLPWLSINPMILKPVTSLNLILSVLLWMGAILLLDWFSALVERKLIERHPKALVRAKAGVLASQASITIRRILGRAPKTVPVD